MTRSKLTGNFLVNLLHAFHRFNKRYNVNKHTWSCLLQIPTQWYLRRTKWPNIQIFTHISEWNSKISSPGQATNKILKINNYNNQWFKLPKSGDRSNFNTHKTCWKCCINNERPTGKKHTNFGWDDGEKYVK
jgi:hypothetical protein